MAGLEGLEAKRGGLVILGELGGGGSRGVDGLGVGGAGQGRMVAAAGEEEGDVVAGDVEVVGERGGVEDGDVLEHHDGARVEADLVVGDDAVVQRALHGAGGVRQQDGGVDVGLVDLLDEHHQLGHLLVEPVPQHVVDVVLEQFRRPRPSRGLEEGRQVQRLQHRHPRARLEVPGVDQPRREVRRRQRRGRQLERATGDLHSGRQLRQQPSGPWDRPATRQQRWRGENRRFFCNRRRRMMQRRRIVFYRKKGRRKWC